MGVGSTGLRADFYELGKAEMLTEPEAKQFVD
jgi:hypothetical protein